MTASLQPFVNTLPYISHPIEEFSDFQFVNWERDIYPQYRGAVRSEEARFFTDMIVGRGLKKILDLGVCGGTELSSIMSDLQEREYAFLVSEANEVDEEFITQAQSFFKSKRQPVVIHKANWIDLPSANPSYTMMFDYAFLTGNSLTYIGGGTREYTKSAQQSIVSKFARMVETNGYLFIDTRNYDYIRSLMNLPKELIFERFDFTHIPYYEGWEQKRVIVFPAYISDTVVVLHYYDVKLKIWSKLDLYPIYQEDMLKILSKDFEVEKVFHDFEEAKKDKSLFVQYLARRR